MCVFIRHSTKLTTRTNQVIDVAIFLLLPDCPPEVNGEVTVAHITRTHYAKLFVDVQRKCLSSDLRTRIIIGVHISNTAATSTERRLQDCFERYVIVRV